MKPSDPHRLTAPVWPKARQELTPAQHEIMNDWYTQWLTTELPGSFGWLDKFNHTYPLRSAASGDRTLEIGAGNGAHLRAEDLTSQREYVCVELRDSLASQTYEGYPNVRLVVGDCQEHLDFPDHYFDRVLAIHVLEHLYNLPAALREVRRVLTPTGRFSVVIPSEGGLTYSLGRKVTSQRKFEKRYSIPYEPIIRHEHVNTAREVIEELSSMFTVVHRSFFPFRVPLVDLNLVIGLTLRPMAHSPATHQRDA